MQRSVLSPLLPEAAIYYLEQYGAEKYAEVFLGEFDNPEVIWNAEMRCCEDRKKERTKVFADVK